MGENEDVNTTIDVVVGEVNEKMGVNLHRYDIDIGHRIVKNKKCIKSGMCIIVKFVWRMSKIKCLKDRKKKMKGTNIYIQEDLTNLNYSILVATKGNDDVEKSWTIDGTIFVKWKGSDDIKKLDYADYEWKDLVDETEGQKWWNDGTV